MGDGGNTGSWFGGHGGRFKDDDEWTDDDEVEVELAPKSGRSGFSSCIGGDDDPAAYECFGKPIEVENPVLPPEQPPPAREQEVRAPRASEAAELVI